MSGGKLKAWHLIIIVAGIAALAWGGYRLFASKGSKATWASSVVGVDVVTGKLYEYPTRGGPAFPAKSPDTQERTVFPVQMDPETGEWYVQSRYSEILQKLGPKATAVTDMSTGKVKTTGEPRRAQ